MAQECGRPLHRPTGAEAVEAVRAMGWQVEAGRVLCPGCRAGMEAFCALPAPWMLQPYGMIWSESADGPICASGQIVDQEGRFIVRPSRIQEGHVEIAPHALLRLLTAPTSAGAVQLALEVLEHPDKVRRDFAVAGLREVVGVLDGGKRA